MRFSVILCSRDRGAQVEKCLDNLDLKPFFDNEGELILVDSGSTDNTAQVFTGFKQTNPTLECNVVLLDEPGLSIARNAGVKNSCGPILIFLDDDVYFDEGYIGKVLHRLETLSPDVGFVGGRIFKFDPSDSLYGCDEREEYFELRAGAAVRPGNFHGTNFSTRRKVYDAIGGFDDDLGAGKKYRCEDIDFVARALVQGFKGAFDPELVVFHHHGRKDGKDILELDRANLYACGAFYAKMVRDGIKKYLLLSVYVSLRMTARRFLPSPVTLPPPWTTFFEFWAGYRDYWRDSREG